MCCIVLYLSSDSSAREVLLLQGSDEKTGSKQNGNFLGCMEVIAEFCPFLSQHIEKFGNSGKGTVNFLSSTTVNELIQITAEAVMSIIVQELSRSKYYSMSVDSTPDLSHTDQLAVTVRYVLDGLPTEILLTFLPIKSHKAAELVKYLLDVLESQGIDIMNCRGQTYNIACNMAGKFSVMQARTKQENPHAIFVPCAAHSLNLMGGNAVDCCVEAESFFGFMASLYNFFSSSAYRWDILKKHLSTKKLTVKLLSETRRSARADTTAALCEGYEDIRNALDEIADDTYQMAATRHEADCLSEKMDLLETAFLSNFWKKVLNTFNATSKALQSATINLRDALDLLTSLESFLDSHRGEFDSFETEARGASGSSGYKAKRVRRKSIERKEYDSMFCS